ncbi:hypothetical protein F0562_014127 [Nyssa sinensis]|uniref:Uncharacterized protein n=1 Tax=Nyssa sinensis TaxID=561372 RepID=A0A5J4ZLQ1_9ASTE|nr:hypothetical protein F0562_014127 [Nyssa sinensis]
MEQPSSHHLHPHRGVPRLHQLPDQGLLTFASPLFPTYCLPIFIYSSANGSAICKSKYIMLQVKKIGYN